MIGKGRIIERDVVLGERARNGRRRRRARKVCISQYVL